jgi:hypothetical protein
MRRVQRDSIAPAVGVPHAVAHVNSPRRNDGVAERERRP